MAFRLDARLSERNIIEWQFAIFGILEQCLECENFNSCGNPQYNAKGLTLFFCADYIKREGVGEVTRLSDAGIILAKGLGLIKVRDDKRK